MGRPPCCDEIGVKKGPWTPEEDKALLDYIHKHGDCNWRHLPKLAGLNRCGKSCRLRWANYLRPNIKRGEFSDEEERLIIHLHSDLGNKWSAIAAQLQGRTDNEIKNYWNTHLRKKLLKMGIDPVTHMPRTDLNLIANLPDLFVAANQGNLTSSWDNTLRLQAHAAYLARLQIIQSLLQVMTIRSPPNMDAMSLLASASLGNYQFNDLLQLHCQSGGLVNGSLGLPDPILMPPSFANFNGLQDISNNFQDCGESSLSLGVEGSGGGSSSVSYINQVASSTPSLVSSSPENPTTDQTQDLITPSSSPPYKSLEDLNLDNLEDDLSWKDILDQISWFDDAV